MHTRAEGQAFARRYAHAAFYKWAGIILLVVSFALRLAAYPVITTDYRYFVAQWFNDLATHPGLTAFQYPFSDYTPLYLYFLKVLTFIPVSSLWSAKTLSFVFDILVAYFAYRILERFSAFSPERLFLSFALVLSIPTMMVNSSLWGQSDSVYAAGVMASLFFILAGEPLYAALAFSLGLSMKLQAIFFLPILLAYLLRTRGWTLYILLIPAVFFLTLIPAWMGGGPLSTWGLMYLHQSSEYPGLDVSAQSLFAFTLGVPLSDTATKVLFWVGIAAGGAAALWTGWLFYKEYGRAPPERLIFIALLCVTLIPFLLPRMHERYFYLADILGVLYALFEPRRWYIAAAMVVISFFSYMPFLSHQVDWFSNLQFVDLRAAALGLLLLLAYLLWQLYRESKNSLKIKVE